MSRQQLLWFLILMQQSGLAQYRLHITAAVPSGTKQVMLAGSFNNWDPGDSLYQLKPLDSRHFEITLQHLPAGEYAFKFSKGSGATLECQPWGLGSPNHVIQLRKDTSLEIQVVSWSDAWFDARLVPEAMRYDVMMNRAGYYVEINLDSADLYATALDHLASNLSPMKQARALDLRAVIYSRQGNGEKALSLLYKSLSLKKSLGDSSTISFVYYNMGNIYEGLKDDAKAMENYHTALEWTSGFKGAYKSIVLMKIAGIFFRGRQYDSARMFSVNALQFDPACVGALLMMGDLEQKNMHEKAALGRYLQAIEASEKSIPGNALFTNSSEATTKAALSYYFLGQKDSAFYLARSGFAIATGINNPYLISSAANGLAVIFKQEKNFDSAFFYSQVTASIKDSLFAGERERQIHTISVGEKMQEKELGAQQEKFRLRLMLYGMGGLVLVVLVSAIGFRKRMKTEFQKKLAEAEMQALRAQMNPHFIFNCLASINRYIVMSDPKTASSYLTKFAKLIRLILDNSSSDFVTLEAEVQTLELYLDMELLRFDNSFEYSIVYDGLTAADNCTVPAMIIQPYVENAIWHGLLQRQAKGKLWIRFIRQPGSVIQVEIEDNGVGRAKAASLKSRDALKTKSFGMQISKSRIDLIARQHRSNPSVVIEDLFNEEGDPRGTKIIVRLPFIIAS